MKERRQVALLGDGLAHFQQGLQLPTRLVERRDLSRFLEEKQQGPP